MATFGVANYWRYLTKIAKSDMDGREIKKISYMIDLSMVDKSRATFIGDALNSQISLGAELHKSPFLSKIMISHIKHDRIINPTVSFLM